MLLDLLKKQEPILCFIEENYRVICAARGDISAYLVLCDEAVRGVFKKDRAVYFTVLDYDAFGGYCDVGVYFLVE